MKELQEQPMRETLGGSVAYLTDFRLDNVAMDWLAVALRSVEAVVCESQYRHIDAELARRNYHMTATQAATLAKRADVGGLVLFHLSDRYRPEEWRQLLAEARAVFPATTWPEHWAMET
jgi:ribonuclease Z